MSEKIWLSSPHMGGKELSYIHEAFDQNWVAPLGPNVNAFETELERFLGREVRVAALSAGTAALHLALIECGVGQGDCVICQSMTFSASANPIVYQGATPVFVDSEADSWNLSPEHLEQAIKAQSAKGQKPKAIIAVHLYGMPFKINEVLAVAQQYDIPVIEDAAEALGSTYRGVACGTFGRFGILSFNGNKIITTSGGGALVCHSEADKKKAVFLSTQARDEAPHYQHSHIGYNYRMSNICAGIGRGQMEVLEERVRQRRINYERYAKALGIFQGITFLPEPEGSYSNRWLTTVLVDPRQTGGINREALRLALAAENIESRPLWKPMHLQPVFNGAPYYGNGVSDRLFDEGLCLPSGSNMTEEAQQRVIAKIKKVLQSKII